MKELRGSGLQNSDSVPMPNMPRLDHAAPPYRRSRPLIHRKYPAPGRSGFGVTTRSRGENLQHYSIAIDSTTGRSNPIRRGTCGALFLPAPAHLIPAG